MISAHKKFKLQNKKVPVKNYDLPFAKNGLPQLQWIQMVIAPTCTGKSNMVVNQVNEANKQGLFDWIVLISTTGVCSDKGLLEDHIWEKVEIDERHHEYSQELFNTLSEEQDDRILEYLDYIKYKKLYDKYINCTEDLTSGEVLELEQNQFNPPENPNPKNRSRCPTRLLIFDDLGKMSQSTMLQNFITKSRHTNTSWICCVQSYPMIPLCMREQVNILVLFEVSDDRKKEIYQLYCRKIEVTYKQFEMMFELLKNPWDFIMICKKSPLDEKYRQGFDICLTFNKSD